MELLYYVLLTAADSLLNDSSDELADELFVVVNVAKKSKDILKDTQLR